MVNFCLIYACYCGHCTNNFVTISLKFPCKEKKEKRKEKPKQIQSAKVFHRKTLERQQCHTILPCL